MAFDMTTLQCTIVLKCNQKSRNLPFNLSYSTGRRSVFNRECFEYLRMAVISIRIFGIRAVALSRDIHIITWHFSIKNHIFSHGVLQLERHQV